MAALASLPQECTVTLIADDVSSPSVLAVGQAQGMQINAPSDLGQLQVDVVIRSPGVSIYREEVQSLVKRGVRVTTLLDLWLEAPTADVVVGVTGTKGKSTTTLLIEALLSAAGRSTELAGNIGRAVTEIGRCEVAVIEVSSYQAADLVRSPHVGVLTNLGEDHLPWHRTVENYQRDKLNLFAHAPLTDVVLGESVPALAIRDGVTVSVLDQDGLHASGANLLRGSDVIADLTDTALEPAHLVVDLAIASLAAEVVLDRRLSSDELLAAIDGFKRPPGRLEIVPSTDGVTWINDSLASNPFAAAAGIATFAARRLIVIVGGDDRGVDEALLIAALSVHQSVRSVIAIGESGRRWAPSITAIGVSVHVVDADDITLAVGIAGDIAAAGDVVLFSPAAPTSPSVGNWERRSALFRSAIETLSR